MANCGCLRGDLVCKYNSANDIERREWLTAGVFVVI